jgi:hypothetical protein
MKYFCLKNILPLTSLGHGREILIHHGEALFRTYLNTEITGTAFKPVNLPFFGTLGDNNGMGWAAPAAQAAENAVINGNFNPASGNLRINPFPHRVHERRRPADQVPQYGFCHGK